MTAVDFRHPLPIADALPIPCERSERTRRICRMERLSFSPFPVSAANEQGKGAGGLGQRGSNNPIQQLGKRNARMSGGVRQQTRRRHARNRVDFQHKNLVAHHNHIRP